MNITKRDIGMIKRYCEIKRIALTSFYNGTKEEKIRPYGILKMSFLCALNDNYNEWFSFIRKVEKYFITQGRRQDKKFGFKKGQNK